MESVQDWEARTGLRYRPAAGARAEGIPLAADGVCPPLYRYPGPCGLRELLSGALAFLAPADTPLVWMSEPSLHDDVPGAALFGTVLLEDPLRVSPVPTGRPGIWVGRNVTARRSGGVRWIPPSQVTGRGGGPDEAQRVLASLQAYLEELACLQAARAEPPRVSWCRLPPDERRRRLEAARVTPAWTGRYDAAT